METKKTYSGQHFFLHLFEEDGKISMDLASEYVYPPINKNELKDLAEFITKYLENDNSTKNHNA